MEIKNNIMVPWMLIPINLWIIVKENLSNKIAGTNKMIFRGRVKIFFDTEKVANTFNKFL